MLKIILPALGLLLGLSLPAAAFDAQQAEAVVGILEQVVESSGEAIYHGGAGEVFEYDMDNTGLIAAAGFDFDGWVDAYDAVMTGYMATIPQAEFDAIFDEPLALLDASTTLTAEEKAVIREDLEPEISAAREARANGGGHAAIVQPMIARIEALVFSD